MKRSIWSGSCSTVVNAMRKHVPHFISAFNENNNSNDDKCCTFIAPDFQHSAGRERGRKREIDREEEVISITLIPRDFAVLGYWFQAGLWSMLKTVRVCSLVNGFSREFQTNEDWKSLELEIGTMIFFRRKKEIDFLKNCQERLKNYTMKK